MKISVLDASNYFKGLLLLMRKDRKIAESEIAIMKRVGKSLDFEKEFCENAIRDILSNRYIEDSPPLFSSGDLAVRFLRDGLAFAFSDGEFDPAEEEWLRSIALGNGIDGEVFSRERERAAGRSAVPSRLEVDDITVEHRTTG